MLPIILAYRAWFDKIFQALGVCSSPLGAFLVSLVACHREQEGFTDGIRYFAMVLLSAGKRYINSLVSHSQSREYAGLPWCVRCY